MKIKINGAEHEVPHGIHLSDILKILGMTTEDTGIAIALNEQVVPRSAWAETIVKSNDEVEVVTAAQGG